MAIEFHCPYCTATVRVGDDAAGKIGRCPKCETKVRIPAVPPHAVPPAAQVPTASTPVVNPSSGELPVFSPTAPPKNPGELPVVPVTDDPVTSKYLKKTRKKKKSLSGWIPPLLFGGLLVGIAFFYMQETKPKFEGTLAGERLDPNQSIRIQLEGSTFNIDQKVFDQIVEELRLNPSTVRSSLVTLKFAAGAEGMELALRPGIDADLVKVPVQDIKTVAQFYKANYEKLDDARIDEIQKGLSLLAIDWGAANEDEKLKTLPDYRNSVAYNAFVRGLGRICYARVGKAIYPCVHEDRSGALYFLVPIGTDSFVIRERTKLEDGPYFQSELAITVTLKGPKIAEPEMIPDVEQTEPIPYVDPEATEEKEEETTDSSSSAPMAQPMQE